MVIPQLQLSPIPFFSLGSGLAAGGWPFVPLAAHPGEKMVGQKLASRPSGPAITFIITGLMALAFVGFSGIFVIQ